MAKRIGLMLAAFVGMILITQAAAQQNEPAKPADQPQPRSENRREVPPGAGTMRPAMMERTREMLKATDAEWKLIEPKLAKVQALQMQTRGGMRMPHPTPEAQPEQPDVQKKAAALRKIADDASAKPEDLQKALQEYREAREKTKTELAAAQKDLKGSVNPRQEALLVLMGYLE